MLSVRGLRTDNICSNDPKLRLSNTRQLGRMRGKRVHQRRIQAVVWLQTQLSEPAAYRTHVRGIRARLDDRGDEGRKPRRRPAGLRRQFRVNEIETVKCMLAVLDAAEHVDPAHLACMTLNGGGRIDDAKLVAVLCDFHLVLRYDRDDREQRTLRLPALGTAAGVVVRDLRADRHLDGLIRAFAGQGSPREILRSLLDAVVDRRMN